MSDIKTLTRESRPATGFRMHNPPQQQAAWARHRLFGFRAALVFFALLILPWHWNFYRQLLQVNWLQPHFKKLLDLTAFLPEIVTAPRFGFASLLNLGIFLALSVIAATVWTLLPGPRKAYPRLNYFLTVLLRYKIGLGLVAYGFYLVYRQHLPYPSLSNLHTDYGNLFAWKVYYQTTAINPEYESFLGFVEIAVGLLLLYRRTVTIGAGIALGFLGNIFMVNLLYDAGHLPYVTFLLLGTIFLFIQDIPRLYDLLVAGRKAAGARFYPAFTSRRLAAARKAGIALAAAFIVLLGATGFVLKDAPYKYPRTPGIKGLQGYYDVTQFVLNGDTLPYSLSDNRRWKDVIFEAWTTVSAGVNSAIVVDTTDGDRVEAEDINRNYELAGAGGRHYYHYIYDGAGKKITLFNKNRHYPHDRWELAITRPSASTVLLKGVNSRKDSVSILLRRIEKDYFMYEGRRSSIKL